MNDSQPIRRALISVSDKTGIVAFARVLQALGVKILSTGGTAKLLAENHISVLEVADYTGYPEIMAGRVKTLHPKIHGGLLGRRGIDDAVMQAHGIDAIDLLVINLYPFEQAIAQPDCDLSTAIENIDIGGPAMLRAAAKNYASVTVLVDNYDYETVLQGIRSEGGVKATARFDLAAKAFAHTARYDAAIANYLNSFEGEHKAAFPRTFTMQFSKHQDMRYGENPHQKAAFYVAKSESRGNASMATARQLQGKALSFNNVVDSDTALECVKAFTEPACVIVKHANPCGVALGADSLAAYEQAFTTDPTSAFGGIIAFNRNLDAKTAEAIISRQFVEVIVAPAIDDEAQALLHNKPNIRVLACGVWGSPGADLDYKRVTGGLLIQDRDLGAVTADELVIVSQRQPQAQELADMLFAWKVVKFVKSNAIVYARGQMTIGIGAGQMSRVYSARIAAIKAADAKLEITGSAMASDAFFPFRDSIDAAAEVGIKAIIQPGGSMRDQEVIAAADEHKLTMAFTGMRHFRH